MSARKKYFVVDTNLFVAAVKPFAKRHSKRFRRAETNAMSLLIRLIANEEIELKANSVLIEEYRRLSEELHSETSTLILNQLIQKARVVQVAKSSIDECSVYVSSSESADILHAATSLETGAILITNDRHFERLKESGKVKVWSITEAIKAILRKGSGQYETSFDLHLRSSELYDDLVPVQSLLAPSYSIGVALIKKHRETQSGGAAFSCRGILDSLE